MRGTTKEFPWSTQPGHICAESNLWTFFSNNFLKKKKNPLQSHFSSICIFRCLVCCCYLLEVLANFKNYVPTTIEIERYKICLCNQIRSTIKISYQGLDYNSLISWVESVIPTPRVLPGRRGGNRLGQVRFRLG